MVVRGPIVQQVIDVLDDVEALALEKDRRTYYQGIVYTVANYIDCLRNDGTAVMAGTVETPSTDVQDAVHRIFADNGRLREGLSRQNEEVSQVLGKALGYPWFKDDQKNFPGADESNGVCVGAHVAESIADEAAEKIKRLSLALDKYGNHVLWCGKFKQGGGGVCDCRISKAAAG